MMINLRQRSHARHTHQLQLRLRTHRVLANARWNDDGGTGGEGHRFHARDRRSTVSWIMDFLLLNGSSCLAHSVPKPAETELNRFPVSPVGSMSAMPCCRQRFGNSTVTSFLLVG